MKQTSQYIRILFVEDLPSDAELAMREIKKVGIEFIHRVVEDEASFRKELAEFNPDIVISDYSMPRFDGMSALQITLAEAENIPFIVLTGSMNEETAVECMKAGANDYVIKEQITRLPFAVTEAIEKNKARIEKIQMEKKLRESEEKFRNIFQNHSAIKLIINPKTLAIYDANKAAERFYGWTSAELTSMKISDINMLPSSKLSDLAEMVSRENQIRFEFIHRKKDGSTVDVEVFSSKVLIGDEEFLHSIIHDISDKKRVEYMLRLLSRAVEQNPVSILITNQHGNIVYCNPAFTNISGYEEEELLGQNPSILKSGYHDNDFYENLWNNLNEGKDWTGELRNRKKNGELYWEKAVISPILDSNGEITHYLAVKEDITKMKKMINSLIKAKEKAEESDQLKSAFLMNMSHEIRTPMNGILGFTELLKRPLLSGEEQKEYLEIIKSSGQRMLNTVNDIIEVSKIETGQIKLKLSPVDICKSVNEIYSFFKNEVANKGLELIAAFEAKNEIIETDPTKFNSILTNLIKNAIKFTDNGYIKVGCRRENDELLFFVEDSGIGIPENRQEAVFNRFEQADIGDSRVFQGSGLGLAIAKSYVEMLGGKIWVKSEPGKGSTFYFSLSYQPIKEDTSPENAMGNSDIEFLKARRLTFLIADDEKDSDLLLSILLNEISDKILSASSGSEAIEICKNNPDIDVIMMDLKMPGIDGLEATKQIREFNKNVIIIAQTAYAFLDDREKALEAGCSEYISKPYKEEELFRVINKALNNK